MKRPAWLGMSVLGIGIMMFGSCGKSNVDQGVTPPPARTGAAHADVKAVVGTAGFGNQCQFGSISAPKPVPLSLWQCPINLNPIELMEPLQAYIIQADCKKKTIDVRSPNNSFDSVTWETMPDGNFYFSMNGGMARLKNDGSGNLGCGSALTAEMWGKIDCADIDKPIIKMETVWWMGKEFVPNPTSTGAPHSPPHLSPVPSSPVPTPSGHPSPGPSPELSPRTQPGEVRRLSPSSTQRCTMPAGCYLHSITRIDQCS